MNELSWAKICKPNRKFLNRWRCVDLICGVCQQYFPSAGKNNTLMKKIFLAISQIGATSLEHKNISNPTDRIYRIDGLFPRIDTSENFPAEALFPTFTAADDSSLMHLASIRSRYEPIPQKVFGERYSNRDFVIDGRVWTSSKWIFQLICSLRKLHKNCRVSRNWMYWSLSFKLLYVMMRIWNMSSVDFSIHQYSSHSPK